MKHYIAVIHPVVVAEGRVPETEVEGSVFYADTASEAWQILAGIRGLDEDKFNPTATGRSDTWESLQDRADFSRHMMDGDATGTVVGPNATSSDSFDVKYMVAVIYGD